MADEEEGIFVHVGRIASEDYDEQARKDAEALTIYWHSPAYNSSNIETYNGQRLKVVNRGESRALQTEYISDNRS